jgi:hypothetical protein
MIDAQKRIRLKLAKLWKADLMRTFVDQKILSSKM